MMLDASQMIVRLTQFLERRAWTERDIRTIE
jgi:hypothetical protein